MARLFIDGFESGSLDLWDAIVMNGAYPQASTTQKASGAYSVYFGAANIYTRKNIAGISTLYFKFRIFPTAGNLNTVLMEFLNANGAQITVRRNNSRTLDVIRGDYYWGTVIGTTAAVLPDNQWTLIEGKLVIADSGGVAQIKVNGVLDINFTGDTRYQGSDSLINDVRLGPKVSGDLYYVDDLVLDDSSWIGDTKIQAISPTGAGNSSQWDPSAGDNWNCVEEAPASDADFVSTNVADEVDLYAAGDLTGSIHAVKCVQAQARCVKEGAPTPQNLKLACRTGGSDYVGADNAVPTTAKSVCKLWETNPNTAAAWTAQEVNNLEIGIKSAA